MNRRWRLKTLPFDAGDQPVPLPRRQTHGARFRGRPDEVPSVQSSMAQPYAGAVPDQQLQPRRSAITKGVRVTVARGGPQEILDSLR